MGSDIVAISEGVRLSKSTEPIGHGTGVVMHFGSKGIEARGAANKETENSDKIVGIPPPSKISLSKAGAAMSCND